MGFVDGDMIPAACYDRPYRLEPSKKDGPAYDVLRDVMQRTRKVGLAAVVIEKKHALAAVIPIGRTLVLNVLRFARLMPRTRSAAGPQLTAVVSNEPPPRSARARQAAAAPRAAMRATPKEGEVIDLAVRRTSNRAAQLRPAKARPRKGPATLHELRRKGSDRGTPDERQLA
jgi:hypothetical protein